MSKTMELPQAEALGLACFAGAVEDAADRVVDRALARSGGYAVLCNVHVLMTAKGDPRLRSALDDAWAVFPDGAPVAWLMRRGGARAARRVGGPDLMRAVLDRGRSHDLRHFLYGSTPEVIERLRREIELAFPGVAISGWFAPAWGAEDAPESVGEIIRADAHVVWVALGAPKQELWLQRHSVALGPSVALGVGAAFDFHAGAKPRAPMWMRRVGLEWLHRFASEPRRLGVRYLTTNSRFMGYAAIDVARRRRRDSRFPSVR
jgi:N-acetylglucosaminyldiphosphoundecaprenol N-acetyl-beta-D-mannosaminyltransferase